MIGPVITIIHTKKTTPVAGCPCRPYYFRKFNNHVGPGGGSHLGRYSPGILVSKLKYQTIEIILFMVKFIVADLMLYENYDQQAARDPNRQAKDVDQGIHGIPDQISDSSY